MTHWRPALRMAARDLRRHRVRALLTCVLVALPVVAATVAALASHNSGWNAERSALESMGNADAELVVSAYEAVRAKPALWLQARPAGRDTERRPRADVDLEKLLPAGSRLVPAVDAGTVPLVSGGIAEVTFVELDDPVTSWYADVVAGRAPSAPDEISLSPVAADELGVTDADGEVRPDASLRLGDGTVVQVVGVTDTRSGSDAGLAMVATPTSILRPDGRREHAHLVDLPDLSHAELTGLAADLNAAGVLFRPREAVTDPEAWGMPRDGASFDVTPLVVGALVILVGTLEVVLVVGAAFAVAARRQVRDLGLLAANGGAAPDVRRALLAQGLVLGVGSSVVGIAAGLGLFRRWTPFWGDVLGQEVWRNEVDWWALVLILVLGSLSSVVAALLPAWSIARLTPVAALSGRFPIRSGEARAHRGAFVLAGLGLLLLLGGGWLTARSFGPRGREEAIAPFVAGLGLLVLVAGTIWATPFVVRQVARLGQGLPLTGRYAFRDAGRHRFRSAAATMALMITVAGAVLAGFAFSAVARTEMSDEFLPPRTMEISFDGEAGAAATEAAVATVSDVLGPVDAVGSFVLERPSHGGWSVVVGRHGPELRVVDEQTLDAIVGPGNEDAIRAFHAGAVVLVGEQEATQVTARIPGRRHRDHAEDRWELPAVTATPAPGLPGLIAGSTRAVVSEATAEDLGLRPSYGSLLVTADRPITSHDLERLRVHGLWAWSNDPDRLLLQRMQFSGLAVAALLSILVVGVAVALSAAESRDDVATLAAVGAAPRQRRALGAMHGLFLGLVGAGLGVAVGVPAGLALTQVDGLPGLDVPWLATLGTAAVVLAAAPIAGWLVTPSRLRLTRRTA